MLICPSCLESADWVGDLDRCARCGSVRLVRRLGEVECRDCGDVSEQANAAPGRPDDGGPEPAEDDGTVMSGLADEVDQALARVLRRSPSAAQTG